MGRTDDDDFTKVNAEGESEEDESRTPPLPADPPLQESTDISVMATVIQSNSTDKIKSLFFGCFCCYTPPSTVRAQERENNLNHSKGIKHEIG